MDLTGKPTLGELLNQLRGEPVEVTGPRTLRGSILGVEKEQVLSPDGKTVQVIDASQYRPRPGCSRSSWPKSRTYAC